MKMPSAAGTWGTPEGLASLPRSRPHHCLGRRGSGPGGGRRGGFFEGNRTHAETHLSNSPQTSPPRALALGPRGTGRRRSLGGVWVGRHPAPRVLFHGKRCAVEISDGRSETGSAMNCCVTAPRPLPSGPFPVKEEMGPGDPCWLLRSQDGGGWLWGWSRHANGHIDWHLPIPSSGHASFECQMPLGSLSVRSEGGVRHTRPLPTHQSSPGSGPP